MVMRRALSIFGAGALAIGVVATLPGPAGGQTASCEQPYSPVAAAVSPASQPPATPLPIPPGEVVSRPIDVYAQAFDSDGDGVGDVVAEEPGGGLRITRGDGDVVLPLPGGSARAFPVGDVDGDGRDEFGATVGNGVPGAVYLFLGTTPVGTTPLPDAGIRMGPLVVGMVATEDGTDRLVLIVPEGNSVPEDRIEVVDGVGVLALGPGGDADGFPVDISVAGFLKVLAPIAGPGDALVVGRTTDAGNAVELRVVEATTVTELTTAPERVVGDYVDPVGNVEVIDGSDGTFVKLSQSTRGGGGSYLWSLDDPCTPLVDDAPETTTTTSRPADGSTAPPATPVAADARFTG